MTKPCGRADRGCLRLIEAPGPKTLASKQFCSLSCSARARFEAGWNPLKSMTREQRSRGGRKGGKASAVHRQRRAALNAIARLEPQLLTPAFVEELSRDQIARLKAILVRADRQAYKRGFHAGWTSGRAGRPEQEQAA